MSAIGPRDLVVCVDTSMPATGGHPNWVARLSRLQEGRIYRVRSVRQIVEGKYVGELGILLCEIVLDLNPQGLERGWRSCRFRKLNDGTDDAELIERIKSCKPIREPANA